MFGKFLKLDEFNPCLLPDGNNKFFCPVKKQEIAFEEKDVFNPAAIVKDGKVQLLYRAEDNVGIYKGTSRICLAISEDGRTFTKESVPVLYPDNDDFLYLENEGGIEDPRVVEDENGRYVMTYTAFDGKTARLMTAFSYDLKNWTKNGLAFAKLCSEKDAVMWSKSGAIVTTLKGNKIIAGKINGYYYMYFGESNIFIARSKNLLDWEILKDKNGKSKTLFKRRFFNFDSSLVEPGPPAIHINDKIYFIYNSRNCPYLGSKKYSKASYCAGVVTISPDDPTQVIERTTSPVVVPEKDYEITGQVGNVCFLEGLVYFKGEWLIYYGTADSKIAVMKWDI